MVELIKNGVYLIKGIKAINVNEASNFENTKAMLKKELGYTINNEALNIENAKKGTIAYKILSEHNTSEDMKNLKIRFDGLASHDITYVGIVQTARASGLEKFPIPYVLTNCHNSLCAVGGTINEDDHVFGLSAAKKYGGIYVPAHQAVIHQYMREMMAGCKKMLLGSDSHTRYGALGTMAIGEGGPELVKQLLSKTYDVKYPEVIAVYLEGSVKEGVGPQDVAIAIIGAVFKNGFVKNKVMEFVGPGISDLSVDFRNGIDVMTTETACLSSIWCTDEKVEEYLNMHGRVNEYCELNMEDIAYYDGMLRVDLSKIEPMIAMPFHPSNAYTIKEFNQNTIDIINKIENEARLSLDNPNIKYSLMDKVVDGKFKVDQAIVAGCSGGTFENICYVGDLLNGKSIGDDELSFSVYPASQPIYMELNKLGVINKLMEAGVTVKTAFCGPCFGAGDVPSNNAFSIRHTTRNFPNREGSKPTSGQIASVALMDARSIAATAINGGYLTPATEVGNISISKNSYYFNSKVYENRVYNGYNIPKTELDLKFGPNIADWPQMSKLTDNLLLKVVSFINDPVTTTDELIPSGETSSYRSNPLKLSEFTLSRKDPKYVGKAKEVQLFENERRAIIKNDSNEDVSDSLKEVLDLIADFKDSKEAYLEALRSTGIGSLIFANKPGDGSAREQAASCQKVLGGWANIAIEYATKRYRSNLINWGILPFTMDEEEKAKIMVDDYIYIPNIKTAVIDEREEIEAYAINKASNTRKKIILKLSNLTKDERAIILEGCLINYYNA